MPLVTKIPLYIVTKDPGDLRLCRPYKATAIATATINKSRVDVCFKSYELNKERCIIKKLQATNRSSFEIE